MDDSTYAEILSERLNHLQNLQTAAAGFGITLSVGAPIAFEKLAPDRNYGPWLLIAVVVLIWGHLFSMYQCFAVVKCVKVLTQLEERLSDKTTPLYFEGNWRRFAIHAVTHSFPSILFLVSPWFFYKADIVSLKLMLVLETIAVVATILIALLFKRAFFRDLDAACQHGLEA